MARYKISESIGNTFRVKCTYASRPPFEVGKMYSGKDKHEPSADEFVLATHVSYGGINYDCAVLKFEGEKWKFERI